MENKPLTPAIAGLIIGLSLIVLMLVYYFTGLAFHDEWYKWMPILLFVASLIIFINIWANQKNNFVTYGSCFGFGFQATCVATIIAFAFTFLFIYLMPDYKEKMMDMMRAQAHANNAQAQGSEEQMQKGMDWISDHFNLLIVGGGMFLNVIFGLFGALIGSAIAKKKPFDPFTQINQIGEPQP